MVNDINNIEPGETLVTFISGRVMVIDIARVIVTPEMRPIFLDPADGTKFNYANVISTLRMKTSKEVYDQDKETKNAG